MLDSLVRVSRRVGWSTDRFATDPRRHRRTGPKQARGYNALHAVRRGRTRPRNPRRGDAAQNSSTSRRVSPRRPVTLPQTPRREGELPCHRAPDRRPVGRGSRLRRKCTRRVGAAARSHDVDSLRNATAPERAQAESPGTTLRVHPFASMRFHVLFNSLFKVLFNFPSRYLSAIGLATVFSLRWSLPPALGCIPKQPDSKEARRLRAGRRNGPDTRCGWATIRRTWAACARCQSASCTPHFPPARREGIRCWAIPASLAVTEGILVSFFSSAY